MEQNFYYPYASTTDVASDINSLLKLSLPESATRLWSISLNAAGAPESADATRINAGADGRKWTINLSGEGDPTCSGGTYCPP